MEKFISNDIVNLKNTFFKVFCDSVDALKNQERVVVGLSWWNSIKSFYEILKQGFKDLDVEVRSKVYFCLLDERVVDVDDDASNYKMLKSAFLDELVSEGSIDVNNILLPDFSRANPEKHYSELVGRVDIWLVWVWEDGHIWSLFPRHKLLNEDTYGYLHIFDSPKPPSERITVSKEVFRNLGSTFVFFMWEAKRDAMNMFFDSSVWFNDCPVKMLLDSKDVRVFSDLAE